MKSENKSYYLNSVNQHIDFAVTRLEQFLVVIASVFTVGMLLAILIGVTGRILKYPTAWSIEVSEYLMVYITLLSASWVLKNDGHVQMDLITNLVSEQKSKYITKIQFIFILGICLFLFYHSTLVVMANYQRSIVIRNVLMMPKFLVLLPIPVGFFSLALRSYLKILERV